MTGEFIGPAEDDQQPSMDPRDPRGETDPLTGLPPKMEAALTEGGVGEQGGVTGELKQSLAKLLRAALVQPTERRELDLIADGHTSEDAVNAVNEELLRRITVVENELQEYRNAPATSDTGISEQAPPIIPSPGPAEDPGPVQNPEGQ